MDIKNASYCIGYNVSENLKSQGLDDFDIQSFMEGFESAMKGEVSKFPAEESQQIIQQFAQAAQEKKYKKNIEEGKAFHAEKSNDSKVTTLPSGLQYEVIKEGEGNKPSATDQVVTHYEGTLIDGTMFDSSIKRGEPATFGLNQVIKGWTEGIQLMSKGAKYRFYIPADLAYGANPHPQSPIEPHMSLIFDVELIDIK